MMTHTKKSVIWLKKLDNLMQSQTLWTTLPWLKFRNQLNQINQMNQIKTLSKQTCFYQQLLYQSNDLKFLILQHVSEMIFHPRLTKMTLFELQKVWVKEGLLTVPCQKENKKGPTKLLLLCSDRFLFYLLQSLYERDEQKPINDIYSRSQIQESEKIKEGSSLFLFHKKIIEQMQHQQKSGILTNFQTCFQLKDVSCIWKPPIPSTWGFQQLLKFKRKQILNRLFFDGSSSSLQSLSHLCLSEFCNLTSSVGFGSHQIFFFEKQRSLKAFIQHNHCLFLNYKLIPLGPVSQKINLNDGFRFLSWVFKRKKGLICRPSKKSYQYTKKQMQYVLDHSFEIEKKMSLINRLLKKWHIQNQYCTQNPYVFLSIRSKMARLLKTQPVSKQKRIKRWIEKAFKPPKKTMYLLT